MKEKSIKKNAVLSLAKMFFSMVLPLFTFPYISRVLGVEAMGQYNYASSYVGYFSLIAGLGVYSYGIREGAKVREDREKINRFVSELLTLNVISTIISCLLLGLMLLLLPKVRDYRALILILSVQIPLTTFGRAWLCDVFEDYGFLTLAQVACSAVYAVCLFLFVHSPADLVTYVFLTLISSSGSMLLCGLHARRRVELRLAPVSSVLPHVKPVLVIFGASIATTIYLNSDVTMLGWIAGDRSVGLYSAAVKIYNIVKQMLLTIVAVALPRLTLYSEDDRFAALFDKVFGVMLTIIFPAAVGLIALRQNVLLILSGEAYLDAQRALGFLSAALIFAVPAYLLGAGALLPHRRDKAFLMSTVCGAAINIMLNVLFIGRFAQDAAAFSTVAAELTVAVICAVCARKLVHLGRAALMALRILAGCVLIWLCCVFVQRFSLPLFAETGACVALSVAVYGASQMLLGNESVVMIWDSALGMVKKKLGK